MVFLERLISQPTERIICSEENKLGSREEHA